MVCGGWALSSSSLSSSSLSTTGVEAIVCACYSLVALAEHSATSQCGGVKEEHQMCRPCQSFSSVVYTILNVADDYVSGWCFPDLLPNNLCIISLHAQEEVS